MNDLLKTLSGYAKQSRLVPAEQILMTALLDFEALVPKQLSDSELENIESVLLALFNINKGQLSLQCSIRIAKCLLSIYQTSSTPRIWNLFQVVTSKPNASNVVATGFIIDKIGSHIRSVIPGLAQKVIGLSGEMLLPAIYAITMAYKRDAKDMEQFSKKAFALAKKGIDCGVEYVQLSGLKLLRCLIGVRDVPKRRLLDVAVAVFKNAQSVYVKDECAYLVASVAAADVKTGNLPAQETESSDFAVGNKEDESRQTAVKAVFTEAFELMLQFQEHFDLILMHFLDLLEPKMIVMALPVVFNIVRRRRPRDLWQLISLFGPDVRKELFAAISKENPPTALQLKLLMDIQCANTEMHELAALAMQLTQSPSPDARKAGAKFFTNLTKKEQVHAELYLETALLYLATPPEDNPNLESEIRGFGIIAKKVIAHADDRKVVANKVANNISIFVERAMRKCRVHSNSFIMAFNVMSVLPPYLIPRETVLAGIQKFLDILEKQEPDATLMTAASSVIFFLANHADQYAEHCAKLTEKMVNTPGLLCAKSKLSIVAAFPTIASRLSDPLGVISTLTKEILSTQTSLPSIMGRLKNPMLDEKELIIPKESAPKRDFAIKILEQYPLAVRVLPQSMVERVVATIFSYSSQNPAMAYALVMSVCDDDLASRHLGESVPKSLVTCIAAEKNISVIQIAAQAIGSWLRTHSTFLDSVVSLCNPLNGVSKCLVYGAIVSKSELSLGALAYVMHDLDNMASNVDISVYALYGLSTLFKLYSMELAAMRVIDIQCQVLFSLLNTNVALQPYSLLYLSLCCSNILPVITPELATGSSAILPMIKNIINSFTNITLPYSRQIMYRTMRAVFVFTKELADMITLVYPSEIGTSLIEQLTACGAFADLLKVRKPAVDFFDTVPKVATVLQRTSDLRASEFLQSVVSQFVGSSDPCDEKVRQRLIEWIHIVKLILAANQLPGTGSEVTIESSNSVKICALKIAYILVPMLAESKPLLGENLDDVVTSVTRSIETNHPEIMNFAYSVLLLIVEKFEGVVVDGESRLLELYDSQFSIAMRCGFNCDLTFSGKLLVKYLEFHLGELKNKPEDFKLIFETYIEGLKKQTSSSVEYFDLVCHLVAITRSNQRILFPLMKDFAEKLILQICEVVTVSMALWRSDPCDYQQVQEFRHNYSTLYADIVCSFIWLQSQLGKEILPISTIVKFYIDEIKGKNDFWRIQSGYKALSTAFACYGKQVSSELIDQAIEVARNCAEASVIPISTAFLQDCTIAIGGGSNWTQLMRFAISSKFNAQSYASLIQDGEADQVAELAAEIADHVANAYTDKVIDNMKCIGMFTIMFEKSERVIQALLEFFISPAGAALAPLKLDLYRRALRRCTLDHVEKYLQPIGVFAWKNFKQGGMLMLSQLLIQNPRIGAALLVVDNLETMKEYCMTDVVNCVVYMQFVRFGYSVLRANNCSNPDFVIAMVKLAFHTLNKWVDDIAQGSNVAQNCMYLIRDVNSSEASAVKAAYGSEQIEDQRLINDSVEKQSNRMESQRKVRELKTFSVNKRKTQDADAGEWQVLDISD